MPKFTLSELQLAHLKSVNKGNEPGLKQAQAIIAGSRERFMACIDLIFAEHGHSVPEHVDPTWDVETSTFEWADECVASPAPTFTEATMDLVEGEDGPAD